MVCKVCGHNRFSARQPIFAEIIVDQNGILIEGVPERFSGYVYDVDAVEGPYVCQKCHAVYDNSNEGCNPRDLHIENGKWVPNRYGKKH